MLENTLYFAIDIDGTLLNSKQTIDERTWAAIHQAMRRGHFVSLATGRIPESALIWGRYLRLNAPLITLNGADVIDIQSGDTLYCSPITNESVVRLANFAKDRELHYRLIGHRYVVCEKSQHDYLQKAMGPSLKYTTVLSPYNVKKYLEQPIEPVLYITLECGSQRRMDEVYEVLRAWNCFEVVRNDQYQIEITQRGVTKLAGIRDVIGAMQLSLSDVVAFGNAENDLEMLRGVGTGIAMGNSVSAVLNEISLRTSSNDDGGVAVAMERILREADARLA